MVPCGSVTASLFRTQYSALLTKDRLFKKILVLFLKLVPVLSYEG